MAEIKNLHYQKFSLKNELTKFVKFAWIMRCSETESKQDLLIPDGYPEIIFVQHGAYRKELLDDARTTSIINRSCIIGIQSKTVLASRLDNCQLIGLKLNPIGAHLLFDNRLKDILDKNKPLAEFGIDWLGTLDQQLQGCQEESTIIDLLSNTLLQQINNLSNEPTDELATSALVTILSKKGQVSVRELAQQHFLSVRHFQRKFKRIFGIAPKKFLNIIRFKAFYKASVLQQKTPANFLEYGYYDQMHFIKDFRKHLGINPSKSTEEVFQQMNQMAQMNA